MHWPSVLAECAPGVLDVFVAQPDLTTRRHVAVCVVQGDLTMTLHGIASRDLLEVAVVTARSAFGTCSATLSALSAEQGLVVYAGDPKVLRPVPVRWSHSVDPEEGEDACALRPGAGAWTEGVVVPLPPAHGQPPWERSRLLVGRFDDAVEPGLPVFDPRGRLLGLVRHILGDRTTAILAPAEWATGVGPVQFAAHLLSSKDHGSLLHAFRRRQTTDPRILAALAVARRAQGEPDEALRCLRALLRIDAGNVWALREKAALLCALGRGREGLETVAAADDLERRSVRMLDETPAAPDLSGPPPRPLARTESDPAGQFLLELAVPTPRPRAQYRVVRFETHQLARFTVPYAGADAEKAQSCFDSLMARASRGGVLLVQIGAGQRTLLDEFWAGDSAREAERLSGSPIAEWLLRQFP